MSKVRTLLASSVATLALLSAGPAFAQDPGAATGASPNTGTEVTQPPAAGDTPTSALGTSPDSAPATAAVPGEQEIIVTATKRGGTLQNTPAAVSAIGADKLGAGGIQSIGDLVGAIPNLSVGDQFGVNRTFIRGVGMTSIDLGADGAVAFLQDGAMISRPSAQLSGFYDLEQVEVLRGPQGTTYGRGATAGAINLVTKRPGNRLDGYARFTYGNYDLRIFEGAIGGPIAGELLQARIATKIEKRDGYGKNLFTGNDVDDRNAYAVRGTLLSRPAPDLEFYLTAEHFRERDNNYAFHYFGPTTVPENSLPGPLLGGQTINQYYAARGRSANLRNIYSNEDAINRRNGTGITGIVSWRPTDFSLVSTTSYHDFKRFNRDDLDVTEAAAFGQNNYTEKSKTFSQEFTANYRAGKLELLGGLLYFHEKLYGRVEVPTTNLAAYFNIVLGADLPPDLFDDGNYLQDGTVVTDAYGAYLQATYEIAPRLKLTAGARYNYEKRDGTGFFTFDAFGTNIATDKSKGWSSITPKVLVEYKTDGGTLLYASATKGFKSGVINVGSLNAVINPETVWSYEAGIKGKLFNRTLTYNAAVFYYDYKDLQVGFVNADSIVETRNAAAARNYGFEFDTVWRPVDNFAFNLFGTYLNAKFTEFCTAYYRDGAPGTDPIARCPEDAALVNLKGKRLPNAPRYSFGMGAEYNMSLGRSGSLSWKGDLNYQSEVFFTEFNNQDARQHGFAMVNGSLTYKPINERFSLTAWGRNLTDKYVIANNIVAAPLYGNVRVGSLRPPRTYGLTFGVTF